MSHTDFETWYEDMLFETLATYEQVCAFSDDEKVSLPAFQIKVLLGAVSLMLKDFDFSQKIYKDLQGA